MKSTYLVTTLLNSILEKCGSYFAYRCINWVFVSISKLCFFSCWTTKVWYRRLHQSFISADDSSFSGCWFLCLLCRWVSQSLLLRWFFSDFCWTCSFWGYLTLIIARRKQHLWLCWSYCYSRRFLLLWCRLSCLHLIECLFCSFWCNWVVLFDQYVLGFSFGLCRLWCLTGRRAFLCRLHCKNKINSY